MHERRSTILINDFSNNKPTLSQVLKLSDEYNLQDARQNQLKHIVSIFDIILKTISVIILLFLKLTPLQITTGISIVVKLLALFSIILVNAIEKHDYFL